MEIEKYQKYITEITDWVIYFTPKLFMAILALVIGFWLVKKINLLISKSLGKANVAPEILTFLSSIVDIILKFIVVLFAASMIGFQTSSLIGIFAAAGFAIGLALQGFMGNFASGITIVFFKPYKVGDWVEIAEKFGRVSSIQIFNTTILTPGKKTLIIPNGKVTDEVITNFSSEGHIRLKLIIRMPYAESFPRVKKIIEDALVSYDKILHNPAPEIGILEYDTHFITLSVRPFIEPDNYWDVTFDLNEKIKKAFHDNNVKMAYSEGVELGDIGT